jgi:hypothetical protein
LEYLIDFLFIFRQMPATIAATSTDNSVTVAITTTATSDAATTTTVTPNINCISDTFASNNFPTTTLQEVGATATVNVAATVKSTADTTASTVLPSL